MRHRYPHCKSPWRKRHQVVEPYENQYIKSYQNNGFAKANKQKLYVRILDYVFTHPDCKRAEINYGLGKYKSVEAAIDFGRGQYSTVYSQLLYLDLIDYNKAYRYHVTSKGLQVLRRAYENSGDVLLA